MSKSIQLFLFLALILLTSCNSNQNSGKDASNDTTTIKELTVKWNDCLVKQDLQTLKTLYAEQVSLYGTSISKDQAVSNKEDFFKNYSDFNQSITGEITITKVTDQQYKVRFPKRSTFNGKTSDVNGYLLFDKVSDTWKITNESDDLTDKNITKVDTKKVNLESNKSMLFGDKSLKDSFTSTEVLQNIIDSNLDLSNSALDLIGKATKLLRNSRTRVKVISQEQFDKMTKNSKYVNRFIRDTKNNKATCK